MELPFGYLWYTRAVLILPLKALAFVLLSFQKVFFFLWICKDYLG